jgi:hypothetical protein
MDNYSLSLKELKNIEKDISDQIRQLKEKQKENTVKIETNIRKKLDEYSAKIVKLSLEYQNINTKSNL